MVLGRYGVLTVDEARQQARQVLADATRGIDAAGDRQSRRREPTMEQVFDRYLEDHVEVHNAEKTGRQIRKLLERVVRPQIGTIKASGLTRKDVLKLHAHMRETPRQANLALSVVSKACNLAELWGWMPPASNPCRGIKRYPENERERFLTAEELGRLGGALEEAATIGLPWKASDPAKRKVKHLPSESARRTKVNANALAAIRLLLLTGARLSEVLSLQWDHVDDRAGTIALPSRKGGVRRSHPVSAPALQILQGLKIVSSGKWVLPRIGNEDAHVSAEVVENAWQRIRARAQIEDVRLHDLRHTVGTYASQSGVNAFVVRDLLRHQGIAITSRYANRDADPIRAVSEAVGERIAEGLKGPQKEG
jgi:integrase